jgi:hypothetical protein
MSKLLKGRELKLYKTNFFIKQRKFEMVLKSFSPSSSLSADKQAQGPELSYPGIIFTYKVLISVVGSNGMEDFKLLSDFDFKASTKPGFSYFTQSIFITNGCFLIKSGIFGPYALHK